MPVEYGKPAMVKVEFDFERARLDPDQNSLTLSGKDVLGIVQSAFDDLGPPGERMIAVQREVLAQVSDGRLAEALRTAIAGAAKAARG